MKAKKLILVAILFPIGALQAANVLFVDAETPDSSWSTLITSGGNTYTLFDTTAHNLSLNDQASIDYAQSFDVIVMSGSNATFGAVRSYGALWNTLSTPMINMGNYLASGQFSSSSWQWTTPTAGGASNASGIVDVLAPSDGIWSGITFTPGTPPTVDLFNAGAGHLILGTDSLLTGITAVAAQTGANGSIAIAHAAAGALRTGSQEQYLFAGMTGGAKTAVPFETDGQTAFLNAINVLGGPGPSNDFSSWIDGFGLDPADKGFDDDPDGDGLNNGVEALFGTNPASFNKGISEISKNGVQVSFQHPRNPAPLADVTGFYQWSQNLTDWYAGDGTDGPAEGPVVSIVATPEGAITSVIATPSPTVERLFLRAGATRQ